MPTVTTINDLVGLSKNTASGTLYYEDDSFSIRSTANYRDRFIRGIPASPGSDLQGNKPTLYVDASASYGITDNIKLIADATNLTHERNVLYTDSVRQDTLFETRIGRAVTAGVNVRFSPPDKSRRSRVAQREWKECRMTGIDRRKLVQAACLMPLIADAPSSGSKPLPLRRTPVAAPFAMPPVVEPDFSTSRRFSIVDHGAVQGDQARTTAAIARAIAAAHAAGAGVVVVPAGDWPTGAIHLRSNVALHVEEGATLHFSDDPDDYLPAVQTSWEGIECFNYSPLIYAFDCTNVAITGHGTLRPRLDRWSQWYARPKPHMDALVLLYDMAYRDVPVARRQMAVGENHLRPQCIQFNRCRNVLVQDVSIEGSPFWTIHPLLCSDVTVRGVKIRAHGHNNDGVDPEMSQNELIEDCVFDQGDDAISVKSGRDMDAWRLAAPCRNVVVRNCQILNGHQLMAIGSELWAGIENVFVDNCHFTGSGKGADGWAVPIDNLLFVKTNERRGGFVHNIHMSNVSATMIAGSMLAVETDVLYQWKTLLPTYVRKLTPIEGLFVSNVRVERAAHIASIEGEAELPVRDVRLRNVVVDKVTGDPVHRTECRH